MRLRWGQLTLLVVALLVAGCVRQAGDPFEAQSPVEQPTIQQSTPLPDETEPVTADPDPEPPTEDSMVETEDETDEPDDLPTLPPVTVISATDTEMPTEEATEELASSTPLGAQSASASATPTATSSIPDTAPGPVNIATSTSIPTLTPAISATPNVTAVSTESGSALTSTDSDECTYTVSSGDNLFRISVNNNVTVAEMREANPNVTGDPPVLQPGQVLNIPGCGAGSGAQSVDVPPTATTAAPAAAGGEGGVETYTIQSGDTLARIASRFNTTVDAIVEANDLTNPNRIDVGQELVIPPSS